MPWLSVNHTWLGAVSAVPTPLFALEVQRAGMPGAPGAGLPGRETWVIVLGASRQRPGMARDLLLFLGTKHAHRAGRTGSADAIRTRAVTRRIDRNTGPGETGADPAPHFRVVLAYAAREDEDIQALEGGDH